VFSVERAINRNVRRNDTNQLTFPEAMAALVGCPDHWYYDTFGREENPNIPKRDCVRAAAIERAKAWALYPREAEHGSEPKPAADCGCNPIIPS